MARWEVIGSRSFDPRSTSRDVRAAWALDVRNRETGEDQTVEVFQADYEEHAFPSECREAMRTGGKSALGPYLDDEQLPRAILLTTDCIRVVDDAPAE